MQHAPFGVSSDLDLGHSSESVRLVGAQGRALNDALFESSLEEPIRLPERRAAPAPSSGPAFLLSDSSVLSAVPLVAGPAAAPRREPEELPPSEALALLEGLLSGESDRRRPAQPIETEGTRSAARNRPARSGRRAPTRRRRSRWG